MRTPTLLAASLLLFGCATAPTPARLAPADAERWEADIRAFEAADRERRPAPGGVVFTGSSSVRLWETLAEDFPGVPVLNRGFGGSQMEHVLHFADRIVLPYRPRQVLVYAGDNDTHAGKTPRQVLDDYRALVELIHARLPQARVAFIAIKPSPSRWQLAGVVREANALIREYSESDPRLDYIDVFTPMIGPDGRPREDLFVEDRLHLNRKGYELWRSVVGPYVMGGGR